MASVEDAGCGAGRRPKYKKCVMCTDSVYLAESRPVRFFTGQGGAPPRWGRCRHSSCNETRGRYPRITEGRSHYPTQVEEIPWNFAVEVMEYARIMKGTETYMIDQYTREVEDLKIMQQESEVVYGEDGEWTKKAAASIEVQIETVKGMGNKWLSL